LPQPAFRRETWNRIEGSWKELKGKIKQQRGYLTDDDLGRVSGKRDGLETPAALWSDQGCGTSAD
jgi:uncharacterized protein YjbJ (UPF0337 family)